MEVLQLSLRHNVWRHYVIDRMVSKHILFKDHTNKHARIHDLSQTAFCTSISDGDNPVKSMKNIV